MVEASATTNLSEVNADYLRLWQPAARTHADVRDIFVDKSAITEPVVVETPIGGTGEVDTYSISHSLTWSQRMVSPSSFLSKVLEGLPELPDRVEVVRLRRSLRAPDDLSDLLVTQPLVELKREHGPLLLGQRPDGLVDARRHFRTQGLAGRVGRRAVVHSRKVPEGK